jgi:hypothetical protein
MPFLHPPVLTCGSVNEVGVLIAAVEQWKGVVMAIDVFDEQCKCDDGEHTAKLVPPMPIDCR